MSRRRTAGALAGTLLAALGALPLALGQDGLPAPETLEGEARVEAAVAEKLAGWRSRREEACRKRALAEAEVRADSMILEYARAEAQQLERPARPPRPVAPPLRRPSDTLTLEPFLTDTL